MLQGDYSQQKWNPKCVHACMRACMCACVYGAFMDARRNLKV